MKAGIAQNKTGTDLKSVPYAVEGQSHLAGSIRVALGLKAQLVATNPEAAINPDNPVNTISGTDSSDYGEPRDATRDFGQMMLKNLKTAGVQQAHKEDAIHFASINPWPGNLVCAEGRYSPSPSLQQPGKGEVRGKSPDVVTNKEPPFIVYERGASLGAFE